jgi:ATP-dependent DNA ligase
MLARNADTLPEGDGFLFEPKWDGLRALVFHQGGELLIQGRELKSLNRYFPELAKALADTLPPGCVLDGEIVVMGPHGLDFEALQQRIHPAPARVARMAKDTPSAFVAFDLLAAGGRSTMALPQQERRLRLERLLGQAKPPLHLTPSTTDRAVALDWLQRFQGAGLDGVMAKPVDAPYQPAKRKLFKIKPVHSADCVVAGFQWHQGRDDEIGTLLLGLHDASGVLQRVGEASSFNLALRRQMLQDLAPLRQASLAAHPWRDWTGERVPPWEPVAPERVAEVTYDHLQAGRFRDATAFLRWRADKPAAACTHAQLDVTPAAELEQLFRTGRK